MEASLSAFVHWVAWWHPIVSILAVWTALVVFYVLYIASINVYENRHDVSTLVLVILSPFLILMLVTDFLMQYTIFIVLFADLPRWKEWTVTSRLKRYRSTDTGWRKHWADEICLRGLNPFAPTKTHC